MDRLLEGIRVLDVTLAYAGPHCSMNLADHGAEVIKVEPIGGEQTRFWGPIVNDYSGYFAYVNRNKKGIALNLKSEEGKEALRRLIKVSDVIVENFRVGSFNRLGFTYEACKEINPKIIYASISGFGQEGPMADHPTYDIVAQAESGMMSLCGLPSTGPLKVGPSIADAWTGTYLFAGICMALFNRERTGEGMQLDCAMTDTMFASLENHVMTYTLTGKVPDNHVMLTDATGPWDTFQAKDGAFVIACGTNRHFQMLMDAIGMPELKEDPRFATEAARSQNYWTEGGLKEIINNWAKDKTRAELEDIIYGGGVPYGNVCSVKECAESEQTAVRNMVWEVYDPGFGKKIKMPGQPIKFHGHPDEIQKAAPMVGEDNDEILENLAGFSKEEIAAMREKGCIQ